MGVNGGSRKRVSSDVWSVSSCWFISIDLVLSIVSGAGFLAGPADVPGLTATETPNRLRGEEDTVIHSGMREVYMSVVRRDNVGLD